ncbi:MAG: RNA polymerase sigma factor [Salibacteraceae bacterium]
MKEAVPISGYMTTQQNREIQETVKREGNRLLDFIRRRVSNPEDAEDILQDVFSQLVESYRAMDSIERVTAWMFAVARNKITDLYRKKKPTPISRQLRRTNTGEQDEIPTLIDILPDLSQSPDQVLARKIIWEELQNAIDALPETQKQVLIWHEFEDKSFKEMAAETGLSINTMLSRKRYAVLALRERLDELYQELIVE